MTYSGKYVCKNPKPWQLRLVENPPPSSKMFSAEEWEFIVFNELNEPSKRVIDSRFWPKGSKHREESKVLMSDVVKQRYSETPMSQEIRDKISNTQKGRVRCESFKSKVSRAVKGRVHCTNGKANKFVYPNDIPEGFYIGRTFNSTKNRIRVSDGKINILCDANSIPEGFSKGWTNFKHESI